MGRGGGIHESVRRLALKGWSVDAIARLYRRSRAEVRAMLSCPLPPPPRPRRGPYTPRWPDWHASNGPEYRPDDAPLPGLPDVAADAPRAPEAMPPPIAEAGDWGSWNEPRAAALDAGDVARVHELRAAGMTRDEVAEALGVSVATIGRATKGQRYGQGLRSLSIDQAAEASALRASGLTWGELARRFGVDEGTVRRAVRRVPSAAPPPPPPAIAAAEPGETVRWDPADDD